MGSSGRAAVGLAPLRRPPGAAVQHCEKHRQTADGKPVRLPPRGGSPRSPALGVPDALREDAGSHRSCDPVRDILSEIVRPLDPELTLPGFKH